MEHRKRLTGALMCLYETYEGLERFEGSRMPGFLCTATKETCKQFTIEGSEIDWLVFHTEQKQCIVYIYA